MFLLLLSLVMLPVFAQENFRFHQDEDTALFQNIYGEMESGRLSLETGQFSRYQILFVQGLSTDFTHKLGTYLGPLISRQEGFLSSFYQQRKLLTSFNIPSSFIPINPNESCEKNGEVIASHILKQYALHGKKIILITQSKGGPDALHGLLAHPEATLKVAGWIAYQPPHMGTYLAEAPTNKPIGKRFINVLFKALQGSGLAITEMRRDFRKSFMERNAAKISSLVKKIPVVSLVTDELPLHHPDTGSWKEYLLIPFGKQHDRLSFLTPFVRPIERNGGGLNDGIAMVKGTCLEGGSACVYLHGIDHFAAVMNTSPYKTLSEKERLLVFKSLLNFLSNLLIK